MKYLSLSASYLLFRLPYLLKLPIFNDEGIYLDWGNRMIHGWVSAFYPLFDGKTPLLMWIFGIFANIFSDPLLGGRLVSLAFGLITLIGIYKIARRLFDEKIATYASLFYIATPILAFYDRQALMEAAVGAIGVWSFFSLLNKKVIVAALLLALGFYIKPSALIFLLPAGFVLLRKKGFAVKEIISFASVFLTALFPLFLQRNFGAIFSRSDRYVSAGLGLKGLEIMFWQFFPTTFALSLYGLYLLYKKQLNLILWATLPVLASFFIAKSVQPRYLASFVPLLTIPAAYGLSRFHKVAIVVLVLPLLATGYLILNPYGYLTALSEATSTSELTDYYLSSMAGEPINEVRAFLEDKAKSGPIVVGVRLDAGNPESAMFAYYGRGKNKNIEVIYFDSKIITKGFDLKNIPYPLYFISRGPQLAGMDEYLVEVKKVYNKGDNWMGIYQLKR